MASKFQGVFAMFPQLARFTDLGLLLLGFMVSLVFDTSGYNHLMDPEARSKSIQMSKGFTIFLVPPRLLAPWASPLAYSHNSPLSD